MSLPPTPLGHHSTLCWASVLYSSFPLAIYFTHCSVYMGLRWRLSPWRICLQCRRLGSIPGLGRSPEERNGNPLQYSFLGNLMDRETWQAIVHGITKSLDMTEWLNHHRKYIYVSTTLSIHPNLSSSTVFTSPFFTSPSIPVLKIGSSIPLSQIPYICLDMQYLFYSFWLDSTGSRVIHITAIDPISFLFVVE